jgi:hypothetical protein
LGGEPFLQGLVEAFDLAAGLRVVRAGVLLLNAEGGQFLLEPVPGGAAAAAAGEPGGVDQPVVGQDRGGNAMSCHDGPELGQDDRAGHRPVDRAAEQVAEVVVQPVQDLHIAAVGSACWSAPAGSCSTPERSASSTARSRTPTCSDGFDS